MLTKNKTQHTLADVLIILIRYMVIATVIIVVARLGFRATSAVSKEKEVLVTKGLRYADKSLQEREAELERELEEYFGYADKSPQEREADLQRELEKYFGRSNEDSEGW